MFRRHGYSNASRAGLSLIEILVAASIAMILLFVGMTTIAMTQRASQNTNESMRMAESARIFFDLLEKDFSYAYPHNNVNTKASLVPIVKTVGVDTDVLQFYTRSDSTGDPAVPHWVRYYALGSDKTGSNPINYFQLRREFVESVSDIPATIVVDNTTQQYGLIDGVYNVKFLYRKWDPVRKEFTPGINDTIDFTGNKQECTHILVRLFMNSEQSNIKRVFTKILPIPESFQN
jgi:type II secretory pathway pseudopilin PulG